MSNYTRKAIQVYLVLLIGGAIGLSVMAAIKSESKSDIPPDRPPCTNIDTCR